MRVKNAFGVMWVCVFGMTMNGVAFGQGGGMPPANVILDEVKVEQLTEHRLVTGEIRSRQRSRVASQVEGVVVSMEIEEGDLVARGDVLAKLDDVRAQIAFDRAMADLDFASGVLLQREAELEESERDLERIEELDRLGSSGVSQVDEAQTLVASRSALYAQAKAELVSAKRELHLRERELEDMTIRAPFAGRIETKSSEIGEWVGRGDSIVTLVSMDRLEVVVDVPERAYASVVQSQGAGGEIEVMIPAVESMLEDGRVMGEILAVLPVGDSLSRLFRVRIGIEGVDQDGEKVGGLIRPGMSVSAWVPTGVPGEFVTVSKDAIVRGPTGEIVYYANDGVSGISPVTRLFAVGDRVAVSAMMLRDGMHVVVSGNERMMGPGQPLNVLERAQGVDLSGGE